MLVLHVFFEVLAEEKLNPLVGDLYDCLANNVVNLLKDGFILKLEGDLLPVFGD